MWNGGQDLATGPQARPFSRRFSLKTGVLVLHPKFNMKWTTTVLYLATGISAAPPTFFTRPDAPPRVKLATPDPYAFNRLKVSW